MMLPIKPMIATRIPLPLRSILRHSEFISPAWMEMAVRGTGGGAVNIDLGGERYAGIQMIPWPLSRP